METKSTRQTRQKPGISISESDYAKLMKLADSVAGSHAPLADDLFRILPTLAHALLKRFNIITDPTITDQEEKQLAFDGILGAGKLALPGIRKYSAKAESLAWPIRILKSLLVEEALVSELLKLLEKWDTEYAKFVDPKLQLLNELEDHKDERILEAVKPFLMDVNEPSRFHAVGGALAQDDAEAIDALVDMFCDEESLRIRNRVCEGFLARGWVVPEARRAEMRKSLPSEYSIDGEGLIKKRG